MIWARGSYLTPHSIVLYRHTELRMRKMQEKQGIPPGPRFFLPRVRLPYRIKNGGRYTGGALRRRLRRIQRNGLPCHVEYMKRRGGGVSIRVYPTKGWTHLAPPQAVKHCYKKLKIPYHITVCHEGWAVSREAGWHALMRVQEYFASYSEGPLAHTILYGEVRPTKVFSIDDANFFFAPILADLLYLRQNYGGHTMGSLSISM